MTSAIKLKQAYCLLLICNACLAQDSIFFRTRTIEVGKVAQIGGGSVLFMPDTFNADKVLVKYRATSIHKIKYASGRTDTVWGNSLYQNTAHIFTNYRLNQKHTLDISLYNLRYMEIRMQYAYYFNERNLSITVPVNFINKNYDGRDSRALLRSRFSTGAVARTFSNKQSKFSFYAGLGTLVGYANSYTYSSIGNYFEKSNKFFINPFVNLGYLHYLNNLLYLCLNGTFGPSIYPNNRKLDESLAKLELRLGCKLK